MSQSTINDQVAKILLKQGTTIFNQAREALSHRDFTELANQARALQVAAQATHQTLIIAQAKLLEQAATRGELHQATRVLTTIKEALVALRHPESQHTAPKPQVKSQAAPAPAPTSTSRPFTPRPGDESYSKRLGNYLVEAELVSPAQIEVALADQRSTGSRLGDILVARGWLKPGTIEFIMSKVVVPERTHQHSVAAPPSPPKPASNNNMNLDRATLIDQSLPTFLDM